MDYKTEYIKLRKACKDLIELYRDYMTPDGFITSYRVKEWIALCELIGEPIEKNAIPNK